MKGHDEISEGGSRQLCTVEDDTNLEGGWCYDPGNATAWRRSQDLGCRQEGLRHSCATPATRATSATVALVADVADVAHSFYIDLHEDRLGTSCST
jgi:hypothetical protein